MVWCGECVVGYGEVRYGVGWDGECVVRWGGVWGGELCVCACVRACVRVCVRVSTLEANRYIPHTYR